MIGTAPAPRRWRPRYKAAALLLAAAGAVPLFVGLGPGAAADSTCADYGAQATANGVRTAFYGENVLPLVNATSVEGPAAAALVSSGASSGSAGAPYPGDAALTGISLVGGVVGQNGGPGFDSSVYPLAAQSSHPTRPHAKVEQPGLSLTSDSSDLQSTATAHGGGGSAADTSSSSGASTSKATAACSGSSGLASDADTNEEALSFSGGTLRIGRIHSEAHARLATDGKVTVDAHLDVGQVTVAGQTVELSEKGLSAGGEVPLPNPAADVLKGAGITMTYVQAAKDPDGRGVRAPGLEVAMTQELNSAGVGTSPSTVTYTFGRAYARVDGTFEESAAAAVGESFPASGSITDGSPAQSATAEGGSGNQVGSPAGAASGASASTPSNARIPGQAVAAANLPDIDWRLLYLALVAGGAALAGGGGLLRMIGERLKWM